MSHYSHHTRDLASKRRDVKHVGVTPTRSCLVGLKHAEARPPPLGIFNLTTFDTEKGKKFRRGLTKSEVKVVQEEI